MLPLGNGVAINLGLSLDRTFGNFRCQFDISTSRAKQWLDIDVIIDATRVVENVM